MDQLNQPADDFSRPHKSHADAVAASAIGITLNRAHKRGVTHHQIATAINALRQNTTQLIIEHRGDSTVGLPGESAVLTVDLSIYDAADRAGQLDSMKEILTLAFREHWEFPVTVVTLDEAGM